MTQQPATIRRPSRPNSALVRHTLDHLENFGVAWAPRFIEFDGGNEVLSWLPGRPIDDWLHRPELIDELTTVVRELHDLTTEITTENECLIHDDLQPRNVVVDNGQLGVIDWEQLRPGRRVDDVAQLCWSFAVGPPEFEIEAVGARWRRLLDVYGPIDRAEVVPVAVAKIHRCIDDIVRGALAGSERHRRLMDRNDHQELQGLVRWIARHRESLDDLIR